MTAPVTAAVLTRDEEIPLPEPLPTTAYWVENYSWHVYDDAQRVGVFVHVGRWWHDPALWRQEVTVLLPDGLLLASRAFARGPSPAGPPTGLLDKRVVEPGLSWQLSFDGPAQPTGYPQLRAGSLPDSFPEPVGFDLTFTAAGPVALFPSTPDETWGRFHYEQHGDMTGVVRYAGEEYRLEDAFAYRDHSRGPRDLSHHLGHNWIQARLADGSGLAVYQVWQRDGATEQLALNRAFLLLDGPGDGRIQEVTVLDSPPLCRAHADVDGSFRVVLATPGGGVLRVDGEPLDTIPASLRPPFDWIHGLAPDAQLFSASQPARLRIDGQSAPGWCERSYRVPFGGS